jgi:antitoxin CptB
MPDTDPQSLEIRRRRLLFRATHRGTQENDLLIGRFVSIRIDALTEADIAELEELLEYPETLLADWLTGREPIPDALDSPLTRAMRQAGQP